MLGRGAGIPILSDFRTGAASGAHRKAGIARRLHPTGRRRILVRNPRETPMIRAVGLALALAAPAAAADIDDLRKMYDYDPKAPWRPRRSSSTSGTG
jgi:hypothetical protein